MPVSPILCVGRRLHCGSHSWLKHFQIHRLLTSPSRNSVPALLTLLKQQSNLNGVISTPQRSTPEELSRDHALAAPDLAAGAPRDHIAARPLVGARLRGAGRVRQHCAVGEPRLLAHVGGAAPQDLPALGAQLVQRLPPRTHNSERVGLRRQAPLLPPDPQTPSEASPSKLRLTTPTIPPRQLSNPLALAFSTTPPQNLTLHINALL